MKSNQWLLLPAVVFLGASVSAEGFFGGEGGDGVGGDDGDGGGGGVGGEGAAEGWAAFSSAFFGASCSFVTFPGSNENNGAPTSILNYKTY
jgi:hypothetical protein